MSHTASSILAFVAVCVSWTPLAQADEPVPSYFFKEWRISKDCSEQHAGPAGHVRTGMRFRITRKESADSSYVLQAVTDGSTAWPPAWKEIRLEYRPGARMTTLPADFECIPGDVASSSFLAMTNYAQTAEPWYEFEHWYAKLSIHGELHHLLIFPRNRDGQSSALIMLQDADASGTIKLDHNGVIHSEN